MGFPILELFYYESCPYCQMVMEVIDELKIKALYKDILENPDYKKKLVEDTGRRTVPCLYIDGQPMHESSEIILWLKKNVKRLEKTEST